MSKPQLHDLPAKYQEQAIAQLHGMPKPRTVQLVHADPCPLAPAKKRLRQNSATLNRTEAAFLAWLTSEREHPSRVHSQSITLRIANGVRYTPDFIVHGAASLLAYEVKGFMRDDAAVKLKVAASLFPWIKFHLVSKRKGGGWDVQEILS